MEPTGDPSGATQALLGRLRTFFFPGGEDGAQQVRGVRTTQRGEFRASPEAKWIPFTAEEEMDATRSGFHWDARFRGGRLGSTAVTDGYEAGHGRLVVKLGGLIPVKRMTGPEFDRGEIQRYLAALPSCPPAILNHATLEWSAAGPATLRVRDRKDATGSTVEIEIDGEGRPLCSRADRPRLAGKHAVPTPWWGGATEFTEWEGLRVASRLEASWLLPEGPFLYFRAEVTSFTALR